MVVLTAWVRRLRGCILSRDIREGRIVHGEIVDHGEYHESVLLSNLLVQMYGVCGEIDEARAVFEGLGSRRNVFSGNIMMVTYARNGHLQEAWQVFQAMPCKNTVSWNTIIAGYCSAERIDEAKSVFDAAVTKDVCAWNSIVAAYAQTGHILEAEAVFYRQPARSVVSWNSMLRGYSQDGDLDSTLGLLREVPEKDSFSWAAAVQAYSRAGNAAEASSTFEKMPQHCLVTVTAIIQALGQAGFPDRAKLVFERHLLARDVITWTALLAAFAANGMVQDVKDTFDKMPEKNSISWNVILSAYAQKRGGLKDALVLVRIMPQYSVTASNSLIEALGQSGRIDDAAKTFQTIPKRDLVTWNCLLQTNAKSGDMAAAAGLVDKMPLHNTVTWTTMVSGYSRKGDGHLAVQVFFHDMKQRNIVAWNSVLQALLEIPELDRARQLFDLMPQHNAISWTSMLSKYASMPEHQDAARSLFERMPERDTATWNAMIAAYARTGPAETSLDLFRLMDLDGVEPDAATYVSALDACSSLSSLLDGRILHSSIRSSKRLDVESDRILATALVDMYSKCSRMDEALEVFQAMEEPDVVSWNAVVAGYARHGHGSKVLELVPEMILRGVNPDSVTLTSIICAYSHVGLLDRGIEFVNRACRDYDLQATLDNFVCLVDLLGRAGRVEEAEELVRSMPFVPDSVTGMNLIGASASHGDFAAGDYAAGLVLEMEPQNLAPYVLLSNVLSSPLAIKLGDALD